jgi:hypothetical protein
LTFGCGTRSRIVFGERCNNIENFGRRRRRRRRRTLISRRHGFFDVNVVAASASDKDNEQANDHNKFPTKPEKDEAHSNPWWNSHEMILDSLEAWDPSLPFCIEGMEMIGKVIMDGSTTTTTFTDYR